MRHRGQVWLESEGRGSATDGAVEVDGATIRLIVRSDIVEEWPASSVTLIETEPGFQVTAHGESVGFEPDDREGFLADTAAIRFRSKMQSAAPGGVPAEVEPASPAPVDQAPGAPVAQSLPPGPLKSPGVAAVLSFFWPGLGQVYNGEIGKGLLFIVAQVINVFLMIFLIGFITGLIVWVLGMVDAYQGSERYNLRIQPTA